MQIELFLDLHGVDRKLKDPSRIYNEKEQLATSCSCSAQPRSAWANVTIWAVFLIFLLVIKMCSKKFRVDTNIEQELGIEFIFNG